MLAKSPRDPEPIIIEWPKSGSVHAVAEFQQAELKWSPSADLEGQTLVVWDPDAPRGPYLHWVVTNIHDGLHDPRDRVLIPYQAPNPPEGETHRYHIWVFDATLPSKSFQSRVEFNFGSYIPSHTLTLLGRKSNGNVTLREQSESIRSF